MAFTFSWTDKVQNVDYVNASDVNTLADGIEETQAALLSDYLTKSSASNTYVPALIEDAGVIQAYSSGRLDICAVRGGKLYIYADNGVLSITGLVTPQNTSDAATKGYVDDKIASAVTSALNTAV